MHDFLADAMTALRNAEFVGKSNCVLNYSSSMMKDVLRIFKDNGYIVGYEVIDDGRGGKIDVKLNGMINDCKPIKPRHSVKKDEYVKFEKRYLPASNVGVIIVSTSQGIKSHKDVKGKIGGSLIVYIY
ncbi:MAG: 30S ribosomal protein S8 [archaeon]|nr:30S ribosomal protein S8 [archaeon]